LLVFTIVPATGTVGQNAASLRPGVTLGELQAGPQGLTPGRPPGQRHARHAHGGFGGTTIGDLIEALAAVTYAPGQNPPTLAQIVSRSRLRRTAPPQPSFGDLFDLLLDIDAASSSVNLDLSALARLLYGSDATLADLLATVLTSGDLGWERLDSPASASRSSPRTGEVTYEIATALSGSGARVTVRATSRRIHLRHRGSAVERPAAAVRAARRPGRQRPGAELGRHRRCCAGPDPAVQGAGHPARAG
jgi:hypothetical protein